MRGRRNSRSPVSCQAEFALCSHINVHLIADPKEKRAWVLHSPLDIRYNEVRCDVQPVASGNGLNEHR
jgi:hypothetical protein